MLGVSACGLEPPQPDTGGTDVESGPFGRGLVLIHTDFQSTNVSLLGLDGSIISRSFTSSYEAQMSWDIAAPTMPSTGGDIVLLDRAFGVVSWFDVKTSDIREQFHADNDDLGKNPWDYLPISPEKAYVTRYDPVPVKGHHGDVIIVNPTTANVLSSVDKRIDIASALHLSKGYVVHPARGLVIGDRAYITTVNATPDYEYTTSYVVMIDTTTDEVIGVQELSGLWDCTGIAAAPDKSELAVICSGNLQASWVASSGNTGTSRSAIVLLSPEDLSEKKRILAEKVSIGALGFSLSYAAQRALVFSSFGNEKQGDTDDVAKFVDLDSEEVRDLRRTSPVQIGAVLCPERLDDAPADRDPEACFITDADDFVVIRFPVENGSLGIPRAFDVNEGRTRPPRYLGQF